MGFPSFLRVSTGSWLSIAVWVMHMSKQMINMFTRAFTFRVRASMGFTCLTPMWVWLVLAGLMSSTSHLVCVFSHILWKQTVNHSTFFPLRGLFIQNILQDWCSRCDLKMSVCTFSSLRHRKKKVFWECQNTYSGFPVHACRYGWRYYITAVCAIGLQNQ